MLRRLTVLSCLLLLVAAPALAQYSGSGSIWSTAKGAFFSTNYPGTITGFQNAVNDLPNGGVIQIGPGRYGWNATVRIPYSGIRVTVVSDSCIFENTASLGDTLLAVTGNNVELVGLRFDGKKSTKTIGTAIWVSGKDVRIEDAWIQDMPDCGIRGVGADRLKVINARIWNSGDGSSSEGHGVNLTDCQDAQVQASYITGVEDDGVKIDGNSSRTAVELCTITNSGDDGIETFPGSKHIRIAANTIYKTGHWGIGANSDSTTVVGNTISQASLAGLWMGDAGSGSGWWTNDIYDCGPGYGIWVASASDLSGVNIGQNNVYNTMGPNIQINTIGGNIKNFLVSGNYLIGSTHPSNSFGGLRFYTANALADTMTSINIVGNSIKNSRGPGIEWQNLSGQGPCQNLVVTENVLVGNWDRPIKFDAAASASSALITDNTAIGNGISDVDSLSATNWTYTTTGQRRVQATAAFFQDSLRAARTAEFGSRTGGTSDTLRVGRNLSFIDYGTTGDFIVHSTGNIVQFTNEGVNVIRAGTTAGSAGQLNLQTNNNTRISILPTGEVQIPAGAFSHVVDSLRVDRDVDVNGTMTLFQGANVASGSSITIGTGNYFTITGTTTVNTISAKPAGTIVGLRFSGALTFSDGGGNLDLNGNFTGDATGGDDFLFLWSDGTNYHELARSLN